MTADPAFWNRLAESYAKQPVADPAAFERKIAVMVARIAATDTVLDVGCGTGSLALRLAPFAAQVHGLDLSSEMIRIARAKALAEGTPNVTFHIGAFDDEFKGIEDGSVAVLSACSFLHLVEDRNGALARMFRLLRPGGTLVTSTACLGESWVPYAPLLTVMRWLGKAPPAWVISKATLASEIQQAGFVDLETPDVGAKVEVGFMVARRPGTPAKG